MENFLLTCSAWLEKIAKNEVIKQCWTITEVKDRLIFFEWNIDLIAKVNLHSRVWNKLYIILNKKEKVTDFDTLYDMVFEIDFKKYVNDTYPILVKATSIKSTLTSTPALQKITKKAIVSKLTKKEFLLEDKEKPPFEILTFLIEDKWYILLNTSWDTLYKRWYKIDTWEAPIKESLACWLVILSNWKFSDTFYDITCWSWTIAIERALLAKNIPPWINRSFAFENRSFVDKNILKKEIELAKTKIYNNKYNIIASDIDEEILKKAQKNAINAQVDDTITFIKKDLKDYKYKKLSWTIVSNPPYWIRLRGKDLKWLYKDINQILEKNNNLKWWIITSFLDFDNIIKKDKFKKRKLYNWNQMCYFYLKN